MKKLSLILMILTVSAFAAELSTKQTAWTVRNSFFWKFGDGSMLAQQGHPKFQLYKAAPYSKECEIEVVITPIERRTTSWGVTGVTLFQDEQHFWQFAVVDVPDKLKGQLEPLYEMHEMSNGKWPCRDNYQQLEETESEKWQYGVTYRMKLSLKDDVLTGTVTKLDGTPCYKKIVKLISPQATRIVRPGLKCGGMRALFERPAAVWGDAVDYMPPEEKKLMEMTFPPYDGMSYVPDIQEKATGFFRVQKLADGRWWAIDPLGRGFVAFGVDHCTYYGHYCEALDKHIHKELNDKKFKSREEWAEKTSKLLKEWGFNLLTAGVSPEIKHKGIPHAEFIGLGAQFASMADEFAIVGGNGNPGSQFPNVFHPDFPSYCDDIVESRTRGQQNDPWLFGYFFDNELCWWGNPFSPKCGLFNSAMQKDASHTAKIALMNLLKEKAKGDIAVFNKQWDQKLSDFKEILDLKELPEETEEQVAMKRDYLAQCAENYFRIISEAFRKHDPNHMLLGSRFAGVSPHDEVIWKAAGKYCDIVTWNHYGFVDPDIEAAYETKPPRGRTLTDAFSQVAAWSQRPGMLTEWSFPALDAGLPSTHGAGQRFFTQAERAKATGIYAKTLLSMPFMVGYDYFMWVDEPELGISGKFPENSNYGLISEDYKIYTEIVETFTSIQKEPAKYRREPLPPPKEKLVIGAGSLFKKLSSKQKAMFKKKADKAFSAAVSDDHRKFRVSNGKITLENNGKDANVAVSMDGVKYGLFNVMLYYLNEKGEKRWTNATVLDRADVVLNGDILMLTAKVHKGVEAVDQKFDAISNKPFEFTYRIILQPNTDWFISEVVELKNIDEKEDLKILGVFLRLYPDYKAMDLAPTPYKVPNLWKVDDNVSVWKEKDGDRYLGVTALRYQDVKRTYWITPEDGAFHADAWREMDRKLKPAEAIRFDNPLYLINYLGRGDMEAMKAHEKRLLEMEQN